MKSDKITIAEIVSLKKAGEKITMLTAYDIGFAAVLDRADIDIILVGDSLGMVVLGYDSTVPVTMEEMLHHAKAVGRAVNRAVVVGDMPFLSYQTSTYEAIANAGRFLKEARCDAVKVEGGKEICDTVEAMVRAGIPVMGHIGLTPQTASQLGGYKVQGKDAEPARKLLKAAKALEKAGAFSIVLECIPDTLAQAITESISIPTIGIGAGIYCDGQVLVTHDLVGLFEKFVPRFVKQYAKLAPQMQKAVTAFRDEVKSGAFPDKDHSYTMQGDIGGLLDKKNKKIK